MLLILHLIPALVMGLYSPEKDPDYLLWYVAYVKFLFLSGYFSGKNEHFHVDNPSVQHSANWVS